jgi:hypothetical protein
LKLISYSQELKTHYERCKKTDFGKTTLPFISREIKYLKSVKNIELKKNKSTNDLLTNNLSLIKNLKKRKFCKIYRYYFSKDKIEEKLMNQRIQKMKKELTEKQEFETKNYDYIFHKNYPPENETEYTQEIKNILKDKNIDKKENIDEIKKNFFEKKHDEYITKMGIEFEKGFSELNKKFQKEKEEQNLLIKKIMLKRQLKYFENDSKDNNEDKDEKNNNFYFSKKKISFKYGDNNRGNNENSIKSKLNSKIFRFTVRGNPYKTIII